MIDPNKNLSITYAKYIKIQPHASSTNHTLPYAYFNNEESILVDPQALSTTALVKSRTSFTKPQDI